MTNEEAMRLVDMSLANLPFAGYNADQASTLRGFLEKYKQLLERDNALAQFYGDSARKDSN